MLSPADFGQLFDDFRISAFRFEALPAYDVPEEAAELAAYRSPGPPAVELGGDTAWRQLLRVGRAADKRFVRVRVVGSPLNDYQRYECEWGYVFNTQLGEDVRILDLTEGHTPSLPPWDFWLFDDATGVRLHYDESGIYQGAEQVPDAQVNQLRRWQTELTAAAVPFAQYWVAHPQYHRAD